jgi:hypothetical protein
MVGKTRGKKQRSKRTTQKQKYPTGRISTLRNADAFNKQRGGDDPVIEGIIDDIKTLNKNIIKANSYLDGAKFKTGLIDPFDAIVYLFKQNIGNNITKKDLTSLTKSLDALLESIENNKLSLTRFYPSSYSEVIPREISRMLETIRTKPEPISEQAKPSKKQQEKIKKQLKEEQAKLEAEMLQRELERSQRESAETSMMNFENTYSQKAEENRKSILYAEQRRLKRLQNEKLLDESNRIKEETTQITQQFNIEIAQLFNAFIDIYEEQLEALHDPQILVGIINTIYPNVVNYTEKINTQDKNDARLYKLYSFQLLILIGMLSRFLKTKAPELKLVIKGGKAAQMILSPKPTLELKSDDIDVLVQHPDPLYAKIFSQQFATFFEQQINDSAHISILLANPSNPNVVKISYITKDNKFVVISDIDSKRLPNPELFDIIETKKSKDIVIDEDGVETTYPFRLTYYHQSRESFLKEKKHWYQKYSGLPASDANSRFVSKASDYLTIMAPSVPPPSPASPEKYETFMPPSPASPEKYETFMPPSPPK